ncbi:hypothetical protein MCOR22_003947 [Pyricularia oryzae]|nr:hypothetical protein MCOR22_003947 [Pyricularia oryzae]
MTDCDGPQKTMTVNLTELDAHEQPSDQMRAIWKSYSRADKEELLLNGAIDDLEKPEKAAEFVVAGTVPAATLTKGFAFLGSGFDAAASDAPIYYHPLLPGLLIFPSIVPLEVQKTLLSKLIHRDLSVPAHQTNMHLHYELPYVERKPTDGEGEPEDCRQSFFSHSPDSPVRFQPKDPDVHRPLSMKQVMDRRLHWVTLGGQYDWTNRVYPEEEPPKFPPDVAGFLETVFPDTIAQAAIVNFYTPGDTMMMHRDVSEETDKGLVSLSLGCDGLFMIAPSDIGKMSEEERPEDVKKQYLLLRLRSGDAIYMTKESRYAWHGVPKVLKGTCPEALEDWPAEDGRFEEWRGWMKNKRINLNVRQMRE